MAWVRAAFELPHKAAVQWYPGHMAKGLQVMRERARACNCVLEVHDARIPYSGRNNALLRLGGKKPHILVLNKEDLTEVEGRTQVIQSLKQNDLNHVLYANCAQDYDESHRQIMEQIVWCLKNQPVLNKDRIFRLMVVGIPNTGKSSLINALRKTYMHRGKATRVGSVPGVTRAVLTQVRIYDDPLIYVLDTPGVMLPNIQDIEMGLRLAAVGGLQDHLVGERLISDFILYMLNKRSKFDYVEMFHLSEPSDNIDIVLEGVAKRIGALLKGGFWDNLRASQYFIARFRNGGLGRILLD